MEGFGLPVAEAMAAGKAIVCSKSGSLNEICGNAVCYTELSVNSLANTISNLILHPQKILILEHSSNERAKSFRWFNSMKKLETLYSKLLHKNISPV